MIVKCFFFILFCIQLYTSTEHLVVSYLECTHLKHSQEPHGKQCTEQACCVTKISISFMRRYRRIPSFQLLARQLWWKHWRYKIPRYVPECTLHWPVFVLSVPRLLTLDMSGLRNRIRNSGGKLTVRANKVLKCFNGRLSLR